MKIILLLMSLVPILILLRVIYNLDKIEKEPKKILLALFIGGVLSIFLIKILALRYQSLIPFLIEDYSQSEKYKIFLISYGEIGLIEEFCKWILIVILCWKSKSFNYIYDGIVYAVFVSLGFACIENIISFSNMDFSTLMLRSVFTIPAHATFGVIMGYYLGYAKYYKKRSYSYSSFKMLYSALFIPVILHGTYDLLLGFNTNISIFSFYLFVLFLFIISILKINKISKLDIEF